MLGVQVDDIDLPSLIERAMELIITIHRCEVAHAYRELYAQKTEKMSDRFRSMIREGMTISAAQYLAAPDAQRQMIIELGKLFECYDAILTPPATGEPPQTLDFMGDASFNSYWTFCRAPAVSIPTGINPHRLPLGLQIVGPYLGDDRLLAIAAWCEQHLPTPVRWPQESKDHEASGAQDNLMATPKSGPVQRSPEGGFSCES